MLAHVIGVTPTTCNKNYKMRHRFLVKKQFTSDKDHTMALFKNLTTALIKHERIVTTLAKAKELRGVVDKVVPSLQPIAYQPYSCRL